MEINDVTGFFFVISTSTFILVDFLSDHKYSGGDKWKKHG